VVVVFYVLGVMIALSAIIWTWVLLLEWKLRPIIREWERAAEKKAFIKGVPGDYWIR